MPDDLRIITFEGNVKAIPFRLRVKGTKTYWNVAAATRIVLEWERFAGQERLQLECDRLHANADWAAGKVVAVISPADLTEKAGSYPFSLTVYLGTEEITAVTGHVEVAERPGYPYPPPAPVITSSLSVQFGLSVESIYQITATNAPTSYGATGLPAGLAVNTVTGEIKGSVALAGTYNIVITATNAGGFDSETLELQVV